MTLRPRRGRPSRVPGRPGTPRFSIPPSHHPSRRDSDVSSIPSTISRVPPTPPQSSSTLTREVNAFLSSHAGPAFRSSLPSARDIVDVARFLMDFLHFPSSSVPNDRLLELAFSPFLSSLACPFRLNRSALRAPGTPHAWPPLLAAIHWVVQLAGCADDAEEEGFEGAFFGDHDLMGYICGSYKLFISGDDDGVDELDENKAVTLQERADENRVAAEKMEEEVEALEKRLQGLRAGPTRREVLEKDRDALVGDLEKYRVLLERCKEEILGMRGVLDLKRMELEEKKRENARMCEENKELKERVQSQPVNVMDVKRMSNELRAVERDIAEAEKRRNDYEEKMFDIDALVHRKLMELMSLIDESNELIRKLKLDNKFQYKLNVEGSSTAEMLGTDYTSLLKPSLKDLSEEAKKNYVTKTEDLIAIQQQAQGNDVTFNRKKEQLETTCAYIKSAEVRLSDLQKEIDDHASRCKSEVELMSDNVHRRERQMEMQEREAKEFVKKSKEELQNMVESVNAEVGEYAQELLAILELVADWSEHLESTISWMRADLLETAKAVPEAHHMSLFSQLSFEIGKEKGQPTGDTLELTGSL